MLMVPHHVAIQMCVYAAPRCFSAQNSAAPAATANAPGIQIGWWDEIGEFIRKIRTD